MHKNIYIIVSEFNDTITRKLLDGALKVLKKHEVPMPENHILFVPGALEIPLMAQKIAETKKPDAIIALGAVIKGTTDHYHYVCANSMGGVMEVSLKTGVPILNGILTTQTHMQAEARAGKTASTNKGSQVAEAALKLLNALEKIK